MTLTDVSAGKKFFEFRAHFFVTRQPVWDREAVGIDLPPLPLVPSAPYKRTNVKIVRRGHVVFLSSPQASLSRARTRIAKAKNSVTAVTSVFTVQHQ